MSLFVQIGFVSVVLGLIVFGFITMFVLSLIGMSFTFALVREVDHSSTVQSYYYLVSHNLSMRTVTVLLLSYF